MTFTYEGADLSTTIKNFSQNGLNFRVEYMDGSESYYYSSNETEYERLTKLMVEQAILREEKMQLETLGIKKQLAKFTTMLASYLSVLSISKQKDLISIISILIAIISLKNYRDMKKKIKELKKYQIFIDMMDELKGVNESKLLECIEFEHMHQIPLTINHLDEYSFGEMKRIRNNLDILKSED